MRIMRQLLGRLRPVVFNSRGGKNRHSAHDPFPAISHNGGYLGLGT